MLHSKTKGPKLPCTTRYAPAGERKAASVDKERHKAAQTRGRTQRSRKTGYVQIDERVLDLLEALIQELRARREPEPEAINWDDIKVGGTD